MGLYAYSGYNAKGKAVKNRVEAETLAQARQLLHEKQIYATHITSLKALPNRQKKPFSWHSFLQMEIIPARIPHQERMVFLRQFATLTEARIPLVKALALLRSQAESHKGSLVLSQVLQALYLDVSQGTSLPEAARKQPLLFTTLECALLEAADATGTLPALLEEIATRSEQTLQLKQQLRQATTYPVVVLLCSIAAIVYLLVAVFPNILSLYQEGQNLPAATQALLKMSAFLKSYGFGLLGILIALISGGGYLIRHAARARFLAHHTLLAMPFLGALLQTAADIRFTGTLYSLIYAHIPLTHALQLTKASMPLLPYQQAVERVQKRVQEGQSLAQALQQETCFSHLVVSMIDIGESSGSLAKMLHTCHQFRSQHLQHLLHTRLLLLQPLLLLLVGSVIGFMMLATMTPLFDISTLWHDG